MDIEELVRWCQSKQRAGRCGISVGFCGREPATRGLRVGFEVFSTAPAYGKELHSVKERTRDRSHCSTRLLFSRCIKPAMRHLSHRRRHTHYLPDSAPARWALDRRSRPSASAPGILAASSVAGFRPVALPGRAYRGRASAPSDRDRPQGVAAFPRAGAAGRRGGAGQDDRSLSVAARVSAAGAGQAGADPGPDALGVAVARGTASKFHLEFSRRRGPARPTAWSTGRTRTACWRRWRSPRAANGPSW